MPRSFPSVSFPIHYSLISLSADAVCCELLAAFLHRTLPFGTLHTSFVFATFQFALLSTARLLMVGFCVFSGPPDK